MNGLKKYIALIIFTCMFGFSLISQPHPGYNGDGSGTGGGTVGSGAPVGSGFVILISLGAGYGLRKLYSIHKRRLDE